MYFYVVVITRKMAAGTDVRCLDQAFATVSEKLSLREGLKSQQSAALKQLVEGHDLFINLPTGFGKSVIFQAAPIVLDFVRSVDHAETESEGDLHEDAEKYLVIVVLPLKALVIEQLERVRKIGLQAADITSGVTDSVLENISKLSIIFSSPETLCGHRGKELLQAVRGRCSALFIDESHCVTKW